MNASTRILIVDDDPDIRRLVAELLRREGFTVALAEDAPSLDGAMARARPDLLILDVMLPGEDGLAVCRRLRTADPVLPILMLTARCDEIDRVVGLEMGADDYLAKPFGPRELLARVRALLRRATTRPPEPRTRQLAFDGFLVDLDSRQVRYGDEALSLTSGEFALLACFLQHPRRVLSRDQILDWTHGRHADPLDRTVDMLVSRLRRKLAVLCPAKPYISTVRSGGYLFTAQVERLE